MATIAPFNALRYNPEMIPDLGAVIAPPYDVISPEKRHMLLERDRHNVIRLILPEGDESTKYRRAGELFREWIASELLISDGEPAIYPYAQTFTHPATGQRIERRGFIARVGLEPFSAGVILPHERTLSGPKQDRLRLMETTDANLEAIFGIYRDSGNASTGRLAELMSSQEPLVRAVDSDGVEHRLWRAADRERIEGFAGDLRQNVIFIVDGHHRYETALNYRAARRAADPSLPEGSPIDSIMMFIAPTSDPGLLILPTHRIVHSIEGFDFQTLLDSLRQHFVVTEFSSPDEGVKRLPEHAERPAFLLLSGGRTILASVRDDLSPASIVEADLPEAVRELDVAILHEHILEQLLGISKEAQAEQRNLRYVKSTEEALAEAGNERTQLVVMMNPTRLDQVERVAESGEVMPQKSTYFYPKLASGLLFNPLWEE
jgi:uncharacterized protein (DUF1015 family)